MTAADEIPIGVEDVLLLAHDLHLSVCPDLQVRVRIRGSRGELLADIATTADRALRIAALFKQAAERADPRLVVGQILEFGK